MRLRLRLITGIALAGALLVGLAPAASAHGERSQEAFLRMRTVAFTDVTFSTDTVAQGETFTITGKAKILDAWPSSLSKGLPNTGTIDIIAPGPVVLLKTRTINGVSAPSRIDVAKGRTYEFEMTVAGRRAGKWHVHPGFAVKGSGHLLGPGKWITVTKKDGYVNEATLLNGDKINLENYQLPFVWIWLTLTFLIGLAWMIYWTVPKRTVTNLAVTSQIPLNTDGGDVGLITKRDHRNMNYFVLVTIALLVVGWIYQAAAFPTKIPQQVIQFAPPQLEPPAAFVKADGTKATYDVDAKTVTLEVDVQNTGQSPIKVTQFASASLLFMAPGASAPAGMETHEMQVSPSGDIAPGATQKVTLTTPSDIWQQEHLLPVGESQLTITGLLRFTAADGATNDVELDEALVPTKF